MPAPTFEVEIKLRVADAPRARRLLRRLRALPLRRVFERNALFDTPRHDLGRSGRLLRIRHVQSVPARAASRPRRPAGSGFLTFKANVPGAGYKVREELEVALASPARAEAILGRLGYRPWFRYEKYRATFRLPGLPRLSVELDETPVGVFFELEGPTRSIDRAARLLGYSRTDYLDASYYELFLESRARLGLAPDAMLFPKKVSSNR